MASVSIFELRVFRLKNSVVLLYTAIRGGNDAVQKLASLPIFEPPSLTVEARSVKLKNRLPQYISLFKKKPRNKAGLHLQSCVSR